jgi:hypothetical protein
MLCEALLQVVGNANVVSIAVRASDYVEGWHLREGERVLLHPAPKLAFSTCLAVSHSWARAERKRFAQYGKGFVSPSRRCLLFKLEDVFVVHLRDQQTDITMRPQP